MPLVKTKYGTLEGVQCCGDESYIAFKGIPYARPPLGELRFKAPEPPDPWEGIRIASEHGPVCPQYNERMNCIEPGSEDCLYLNVYTKSLTPKGLCPVMVWIHGGGFYTGSGNSGFYGPEFLMRHNVVLVTINYRLEVLGFLCLDTEEVPGNAGLRDQVLALKWIKENIKCFGGDPNNVTLFGCSAGAASISCHLVSKMSKGLFHKAICQSGVCLNEWSYNIYARQRAFQLGKLLGKETENAEELLEFLRMQPVSLLVNIKLPPLIVKHYDVSDGILFGPVVEKAGPNDNKFLGSLPPKLVKTEQMHDVPIIVGYTSGEGIEIARNLAYIWQAYSIPGFVVPRELKLRWTLDNIAAADKKIRKYYFQNKEITAESHQEISDLETDKTFAYNIVRYARYHNKYAGAVYLYIFNAETSRNSTKKKYKMEHVKGVCHADELPYLFNVTAIDIPLTEEAKEISQQLVTLWVNFATSGVPSKEWKPFQDSEQDYIHIGHTIEYKKKPNEANNNFWNEIYGDLI